MPHNFPGSSSVDFGVALARSPAKKWFACKPRPTKNVMPRCGDGDVLEDSFAVHGWKMLKVCSFPIAMICYKSLCTSQHRPFHSLFGSSCLPALVGWRVQASSRWQEEGARSHCGGSLPVEAGGEHPMWLAGTRWWWPELPSFMWSFSFAHGVVSTCWKPHRMVEKKNWSGHRLGLHQYEMNPNVWLLLLSRYINDIPFGWMAQH